MAEKDAENELTMFTGNSGRTNCPNCKRPFAVLEKMVELIKCCPFCETKIRWTGTKRIGEK